MGISYEAANPRHEHAWAMFKHVKLPDGKVLIPGVLDSTNNFIEHPELIAQRICNIANLVGRQNVIAGLIAASPPRLRFRGRPQNHVGESSVDGRRRPHRLQPVWHV
jgi:hypothetical protein